MHPSRPVPHTKQEKLTTDRVTPRYAACTNRSPQEHGKLLVKRLVALPGDKVRGTTLFTRRVIVLPPRTL